MNKVLYFCAGVNRKGGLEFARVSAVAPRVAFFADVESAWVQASARYMHVFRFEVDAAGARVPGSLWVGLSNPECEVKASVMFLSCLHELTSAVASALEKGGVQCV